MNGLKIFYWQLVGMIAMALVYPSCDSTKEDRRSTSGLGMEPRQQFQYAGSYVSDGYAQREERYDWVGVVVKNVDAETISVSVRSRADLKKPTCFFNTGAKRVDATTYKAVVDGNTVLFSFNDNAMTIAAVDSVGENSLYYYCSGGATLSGTYRKIEGQLDQRQVDKTSFMKILSLQNIGFEVLVTDEGTTKTLKISPFGLTTDNRPVSQETDGEITDAVIEDLNSDGFPEVLVYIQRGKEHYGDVIAYSVNNGKSITPIYFAPVSENADINGGYMGHDEFTLVETSLVQRFPLFLDGSSTGKIRQVQYMLADGEASRKFVVKSVTEFEAD